MKKYKITCTKLPIINNSVCELVERDRIIKFSTENKTITKVSNDEDDSINLANSMLLRLAKFKKIEF